MVKVRLAKINRRIVEKKMQNNSFSIFIGVVLNDYLVLILGVNSIIWVYGLVF